MSTDEADASDDEVSMAAAMGGAEEQDTTTHVPEADRIAYDEMVKRGAEFLQGGVVEISQLQPKEYHEATDEEFLADVQDKLNEERGESEESQTTSRETDANTVDWDALWEEFGFDSPGPDGHKYISSTQLKTALECTDQACPSGKATISQAAEDGDLHEVTARNEDGQITTLGYVRTPGGDAR